MNLHNPVLNRAEADAAPRRRLAGAASVMASLALLAVLGFVSALLYRHDDYLNGVDGGIATYIIVFIKQFSLYLSACYVVLRCIRPVPGVTGRRIEAVAVLIVLLFAVSFRAELAGQAPYLSSDVYRYIWDGKVQASGINPYRYIPAAEELESLRDDRIYPNINRRDFAHTIYPPVAQAIFLAIYSVFPSSVAGFKVAMSVFDLAAIAAIMLALRRAGLDPSRAIIFAWHPLVVWEGAHSGHIESAAMAFIAAALLAWSYERPVLAGAALALATLVKLYPAILLPAFLVGPAGTHDYDERQGWPISIRQVRAILFSRFNLRLVGAFIATIVIAYLPYLKVGWGVTGYLSGYLAEEGFTDAGSRYFLLSLIREVISVPAVLYEMAAALALVILALWIMSKPKRSAIEVAGHAASMVGMFLVLSSPRFGWYMAWIIPFLCFVPRAGWFYLSGASVLLYLLWLTDSYPGVPLWLGAAVYVPALILLAWEYLRNRAIAVVGG